MSEPIQNDLHAGHSGVDLDEKSFDLGEGITLCKTYVHLMANFIIAFAPAAPNSPTQHRGSLLAEALRSI